MNIQPLEHLARTHTCGELGLEHAGQQVVLLGWVHRLRDLGSLAFIDIRDRYGITQVVARDNPALVEAVAIVPEHDVQGIREGQAVRLTLPQLPGQRLPGRVREIARLQSDELPPQIVAEKMLSLDTERGGPPRPLYASYRIVIALEPRSPAPLVGATGWARIEVDPLPLGKRFYRAIRGTFRTPW